MGMVGSDVLPRAESCDQDFDGVSVNSWGLCYSNRASLVELKFQKYHKRRVW